MKKVEIAKVLDIKCLATDIYDLKLEAKEISKEARAGQFVEVFVDNNENLLPRPISICEIGEGSLRLVFQVVGKGTKIFSELNVGDSLRILGPCGNGFGLKGGKNVLIGGGIGVPPMLELCKSLEGEKTVVLGFRSGCFLKEDFEALGAKVYIATDDGSVGFKGNVVQLLKAEGINEGNFYSCGPKVMLKALHGFAAENNIDLQVSMEERMACGIGACVGCVVKIGTEDNWEYKKVCKDGPVFNSREVLWNE